MKRIFILLPLLLSLIYAGNQMAKLKMSCDIGNEKACQKLLELKNNTGSTTKQSYQSVSARTYKDKSLRWQDLNAQKYQLQSLREFGVNSPKEAQKWIDLGIVHSRQLEHWANAGIKDPAIVKQWMQIIKVSNKPRYRNNAINNNDSMQGDYLHTIWAWQQLKINDPFEVKKWMHLKLRTDQVKKWKTSVNTPEEASDWLKDGFVSGYLWKAKGFSIKEGKRWKEARIYDGYLFNPKKHTIERVLEYKKCTKFAKEALNKISYSNSKEQTNHLYNIYYSGMKLCKSELNKKDNNIK